MASSRFNSFNAFIVRHRRLVIVTWVLVLIISATQIPVFFGAVSYNISNADLGGPKNTESQEAQNVLNAEFPTNASGGNNGIIVVLQTSQAYSTAVKAAFLGLNRSLASDPVLAENFTGMDSIYASESSLLVSTVPDLLTQVSALASNIGSIDTGAHELLGGSYLIVQGIRGINQTAQLVYGIPSSFVQAWSDALASCSGSPACADAAGNQSVFPQVEMNAQSLEYYNAFLEGWNSSFASQPSPTSPAPLAREQAVIDQMVSALESSSQLSRQEAQTIQLVATGLDASTWYQKDAVGNLTVKAFQAEFPAGLSSSLGISLNDLVGRLIDLGPSPSNATLLSFTIGLFTESVSSNPALQAGSAFTPSELVTMAYDLGPSPAASAAWDLSSEFVSNATASSFSTSPLFHANASSLAQFLSTLNNRTTSDQVRVAAGALVENRSVSDYPLVMTRAITQDFVSQDNKTMIVVYNFLSQPNRKEIAAFQSEVEASGVGAQGSYWVTGSAVVQQDVSSVFGPVVGVTVVPGVIASIVVVGLLLLSPLAALIPVMVGGFAIAISLPLIYLGVVKIGHESLGFLTPTLTILLVLALSVDYSVLQLRRTREERLKGKSKEESVATSLRWAGQAVLTAGLTVIVVYLVMAVTNVPLFNDVGTGIAIAVSILVAAALTLLPALELSLGDRIFWPKLPRARSTEKPSRLRGMAERTLHRKVAVVLVISALALGAFYVSQQTPAGSDLLKLLPDFPSNHGLTVMTDSFGSALTGSTMIVVTMPTKITYGTDQLNQTLLNDIEKITSTAAGVNGVVTITGPTRPYGSPFDYAGVQQMPQPERSQYLIGLLSDIGKDNRTAVVNIGLKDDPESQSAINVLLNIESKVNSLSLPSGTVVYYGGTTQATQDSQSFFDGIIPQVILTLAVAIYIILFIQLRSAFTPIRLIFTILCSVAFSLAVLVLIFYYALGLPVFDFAPLFVVVTMLGVGIDYDIFLVTRIREEVLNGKSDDEAIKTAVSKSWVTIFGLGLVLSSVFASVLFTGIALLQQIGMVVAVAVMIDVSVVILFFVPALMGLAQRYIWWPSKMSKREEA